MLGMVGRKIRKAYRGRQVPHGKQSVRKLMAHGTATNSIELSGDAKSFDRVARKWNVDYAYNMKKVCLAVLPALTIVLELLPLGAVCIFATSPTERVKETFSYFSLTPFGYANFAPLITATLTVAIFLLSLFSLKKKGVLKALFVLSIITVVISLLPLMYGLNYYTLVGAFITATLVIESILAKIQQK